MIIKYQIDPVSKRDYKALKNRVRNVGRLIKKGFSKAHRLFHVYSLMQIQQINQI